MPTTIKKTPDEKMDGHAIISSKVKNYANDHFFVKKTEEAKETIKKVGLPGNKKSK